MTTRTATTYAIQDRISQEWLTHDGKWTAISRQCRQFDGMKGSARVGAELDEALAAARAEGRDPVVYDITL